jgi:hypothetical protein
MYEALSLAKNDYVKSQAPHRSDTRSEKFGVLAYGGDRDHVGLLGPRGQNAGAQAGHPDRRRRLHRVGMWPGSASRLRTSGDALGQQADLPSRAARRDDTSAAKPDLTREPH